MKQQSGFSLIELMISLVLGLIILSGVIQVFVSTRATNSLNQAIAEVQEYGRYITLRLQDELREVGRYDLNTTDIEDSTDLVLESSFVLRQPMTAAPFLLTKLPFAATHAGTLILKFGLCVLDCGLWFLDFGFGV